MATTGIQILKDTFKERNAAGSPVFVAFVTAGYPTPDHTVDVMLALERGGVDLIELGIPHTDPLADGPVIQESSNVALQAGTTVAKCIGFVREARAKGLKVPVVFMGYYNPLRHYGEEKLIKECAEVGVHGTIIVDLPPEEGVEIRKLSAAHGISYIPLVAPTTANDRLDIFDKMADSFVYVVSMTGVTGKSISGGSTTAHLPGFIARVKAHIKSAPLAVGFGISSKEQFEMVGGLGEGVVIGSAVIKAITAAYEAKTSIPEAVEKFCKDVSVNRSTIKKAELPSPSPDTTLGRPETPLQSTFGQFGGRYAPETLTNALEELEAAYITMKADPEFHKELRSFYDYVGRPTPLYHAKRLSAEAGGAQIWLKREDLCHTGAHKINNAIGQALIARRLGKKRIIAETGAGQHGVATATVCAKMGLECVVYMGSEDIQRQSLNVFRMKMLGATVVPVESGSKTLKDAINEAMRDWVTNIHDTHYLIGSVVGPHPFPTIVRDFQSVIGSEAKEQCVRITGRMPDAVMACVGGGSNAMGMFYPFIEDKGTKIIGVEAAGHGVNTDLHCATCCKGTPGVLHGCRTLLLQDADGQIVSTHSVSAGLDYPGVGPEHAWLADSGRGTYAAVTDEEAMEGFKITTRTEGIIPALETSHALYHAVKVAATMKPEEIIIVSLSGRGDKDMMTVAKVLNVEL